jgi:hypothetical protein
MSFHFQADHSAKFLSVLHRLHDIGLDILQATVFQTVHQIMKTSYKSKSQYTSMKSNIKAERHELINKKGQPRVRHSSPESNGFQL